MKFALLIILTLAGVTSRGDVDPNRSRLVGKWAITDITSSNGEYYPVPFLKKIEGEPSYEFTSTRMTIVYNTSRTSYAYKIEGNKIVPLPTNGGSLNNLEIAGDSLYVRIASENAEFRLQKLPLRVTTDTSIQYLPVGTTVIFPIDFKFDFGFRKDTYVNGKLVKYSDSYNHNMDYWEYACSVNLNPSLINKEKNVTPVKFVVAEVQGDKPMPNTTSVTISGKPSSQIANITCQCLDWERNGTCPFRFGTFQKFLNDKNIRVTLPPQQKL